MLKVVSSLEPWVFSELLQICSESLQTRNGNIGIVTDSQIYRMNKEQYYYEDLISYFLHDHGKMFFWEESGEHVSACRMIMEDNRFLLHNLETKPSARRKGYAKKLLSSIIDHLANKKGNIICVHIKKDNKPSVALHTAVGFLKVKDTARLLDGSVSSDYITMEYQIK